MPEDRNEDELRKELANLQSAVKELGSKIDRMEKHSYIGADDQIFLGALLTFITVFLSLQFGDVANFFESVNSPTAIYSAIILKSGSVIFLGAAIGLRYWASLTDDPRPNAFLIGRLRIWYSSPLLRYASIESLITGFVFLIVVVVMNVILILPMITVEVVLFLLVVLVIQVSGWVEDKILTVFKTKDLIPSDSKPFAKIVFSGSAVFVSLIALSFVFLNLLIFVVTSAQAYPPEQLIFRNLSFATLALLMFNKLITFLLFIIGLFVSHKVISRYGSLNNSAKENNAKRLRRKRKRIFDQMIRRALLRIKT